MVAHQIGINTFCAIASILWPYPPAIRRVYALLTTWLTENYTLMQDPWKIMRQAGIKTRSIAHQATSVAMFRPPWTSRFAYRAILICYHQAPIHNTLVLIALHHVRLSTQNRVDAPVEINHICRGHQLPPYVGVIILITAIVHVVRPPSGWFHPARKVRICPHLLQLLDAALIDFHTKLHQSAFGSRQFVPAPTHN